MIIEDTKIITRFLFLPKTINGRTRWLEKVKILYRYKQVSYVMGDCSTYDMIQYEIKREAVRFIK